jgi:hypothetical protein
MAKVKSSLTGGASHHQQVQFKIFCQHRDQYLYLDHRQITSWAKARAATKKGNSLRQGRPS